MPIQRIEDPLGILGRSGCSASHTLRKRIEEALPSFGGRCAIGNLKMITSRPGAADRDLTDLQRCFSAFAGGLKGLLGKVLIHPLCLRNSNLAGQQPRIVFVFVDEQFLASKPDLLSHELAHALIVVRNGTRATISLTSAGVFINSIAVSMGGPMRSFTPGFAGHS
jgi:hypothetical protein